MSLMSALYVGTSGLQTSQNALNTTAHNLSNADTVGYTRQQVQQSGKSYITLSKDPRIVAYKQTGLGVSYSRVKQVRDYFLDKAYRKESGRSMFYQVSTEVLEETESLLGELNGEAFQDTIEDFWTSVQELVKDPCSTVTQGMLVQRASEFIERAGAIYDGLSSYQNNLNVQIKQQVDKINKYGKKLMELNDQIRAIESGGIEHANDLRDARNEILDELAQLTNMTYDEYATGDVWVRIEGVDFVKGSTFYEIGLDEDPDTGFYTPFWYQNAEYTVLPNGNKEYDISGAKVFDMSRIISADLGTDIGGLKAMLLARGDHRADYSDIQRQKFDYRNDEMVTGYDDVSQSVIMNIQAEFDQLIHNVVTKLNGILADVAGVKTAQAGEFTNITAEDGTVLFKDGEGLRFAEIDDGGYMRAEDGSPLQLFTKISTAGYQKVTATVLDENGNSVQKEYWLYNEEDMGDPYKEGDMGVPNSLYTLKNLQINQELMQKPSTLGFRKPDGSEDKETVERICEAFSEEEYTLNPNVKKKTSFIDYYDDLVSQVANSGSVFRSIYYNQEGTVESIENSRQQVVGVSDDEELSAMIRFQNAYNASSRYINVIDELLEHIINTLGV